MTAVVRPELRDDLLFRGVQRITRWMSGFRSSLDESAGRFPATSRNREDQPYAGKTVNIEGEFLINGIPSLLELPGIVKIFRQLAAQQCQWQRRVHFFRHFGQKKMELRGCPELASSL